MHSSVQKAQLLKGKKPPLIGPAQVGHLKQLGWKAAPMAVIQLEVQGLPQPIPSPAP